MWTKKFLARSALVAGLAATVVALAGCGASDGESKPLTLRVGDQLNVMRGTLSAAGEDKPADYKIQWSSFFGGPAVIAAQTGGSVDLGWMAETPLIFAQAAGSPVKVVAVGRREVPGASPLALVVAPGSPIRSVADLKGRSVGFMPGTVMQYFVVRLLEREGLSLADVRPVHLTGAAAALLANGTVDATVTSDPVLSQQLEDGAVRVIATGGEPLTAELNYLVAPDRALADPARAAAIGDFVERFARASLWQGQYPDEAAPTIARVYNISPKIAEEMLRRAPIRYVPVDARIIARHQEEADTFHRLGLIRARLDTSKIFDPRYDARVLAAGGTTAEQAR